MKRSRASAVVLAASSLFAASLVPVVAAPPALAANVITSSTVIVAGASGPGDGLAIAISGAGFGANPMSPHFSVDGGTSGLTYAGANSVGVDGSTVIINFSGVATTGSFTVQALSSAYTNGGGNSNTLTISIAAQATPPPPATITSGSSLVIGRPSASLAIDLTDTQFRSVLTTSSFDVNVGTTGLSLSSVVRDGSNPMRARLNFTGPVAAGTLTVAVDDTALNPSIGGRTNTLSFTATSTPTPTVSGVSPSSGPANGTTSVTLTGTGFTGASAVTFGGTAATSVTVVNDTTITATTPSLSAGAVDVAVTTAGGTGTLNSGFTYTSSPTPDPVPVPDPPSAPRDVTAEGADASARVEWSPPASQGSFAISHYQARALPGGSVCLVPSTQTTCVVKGLRNGSTYSVQVSALTGAGWGAWSDAVSVTPKADPKKTIIISGSRDQGGKAVVVRGTSEGLAGQTLQSWVRIAVAPSFSKGSTREVASDGTFTWSRKTGKRLSVYFATLDGSVKSNSVTVAAL